MKTHILCSITFFRKSHPLWENVEKYGGAKCHKWRHNTAHMSCMLDKQGYMHARACTRQRVRAATRKHARTSTRTQKYIILLFLGKTGSRMRVNITLYVHCLSCLVMYEIPVTISLQVIKVCVRILSVISLPILSPTFSLTSLYCRSSETDFRQAGGNIKILFGPLLPNSL
jgi:hypothetical protein